MTFTHRRLRVIGTLVFLLATPAAHVLGQMPPDSPVREAVEARLEALQRIAVEYEVVIAYTPSGVRADASNSPTPIGGSVKLGTERFTQRFSFLHGRARWESKTSNQTLEKEKLRLGTPVVESLHIYSEGVMEHMDVRTDRPLGSIEPRPLPPQLSRVEFALGVRDNDTGGWMTSEALRAMELSRDEDGRIVLHRVNERNMRREWLFDPAKGYAMVAYRLYDHRPPHGIRAEITASAFKSVDGVPLPFAMTFRSLDRDGIQQQRWDGTVTRYILNGPDNTPEHYHVPWRKGMTVIDRRTGNVFKIMRDGQLLTSETLSQATRAPVPGAQPTTAPGSPPQLVRWVAQPTKSVGQAQSGRRSFPYVLAALLFTAALAAVAWHRMRRRKA